MNEEHLLQAISTMLEDTLEQKLEEKLEQKLEQKLDQKLEQKLEDKLEQKLDEKLEQKLEAKLEQKLEDKLEQKFEENLTPVYERLDRLDNSIVSINHSILDIYGVLRNHDTRLENLEHKTDSLNTLIVNMDNKIADNQEAIMNNFVDIKETQTVVSIHSEKLKMLT